MTLAHPGWLWALLGVVAVAAWALFRPGRQLVHVACLSLWRQAVQTMDRAARRRTRRISASWVALLAGAAAGVLALAGPVVHSEAPVRRLAVGLCPSAELAGGDGVARLKRAARRFIERLDSTDRLQLLLPSLLGGARRMTSRDEALAEIERLRLVWAPAAELLLPPPSNQVQATVMFVPAGTDAPHGANVAVMAVPTELPPLAIEAVAAEQTAGGKVEFFAAVRNRTKRPLQAAVSLLGRASDQAEEHTYRTKSWQFAPGQRRSIIETLGEAAAVGVRVEAANASGAMIAAWLVPRDKAALKVAMLGRDEPLIRKFLRVAGNIERVAAASDADVVIANAAEAPAGTPALVIDPPNAPPGWQAADEAVGPLARLERKRALDPVLRDVALDATAVRRARPWRRGEAADQVVLAACRAGAVILRTDPAAGERPGVRRIYVAFDLSAANTHFGRPESLPILLANAIEFLWPAGRSPRTYECVTPMEMGPIRGDGWRRLTGAGPGGDFRRMPLPRPGLYADRHGRLHAVNAPGLGRAARPTTWPARATAELSLPDPARADVGTALGPGLVVAMMLLWTVGWALRTR